MNPSPKPPLVVPNRSRRDLLIALAAGVAILALGLWAISSMGRGVAGNVLTGKIIRKTFTPAPEEQIVVGKGGVHAKDVAGEYIFELESGGKTYNVWVPREVYESKKIGDPFPFRRPR